MVSDAIEREIVIRASIDHVWSLVSKPGFWIGDKLHFDAEALEGQTVVIDTTKYGRFPVGVERLESPRYAAYRCWSSESPDAYSTLVEFTLDEHPDGVRLQLKESGFATLPGAQPLRDANVKGWTTQLDLLRNTAEGAPH